jgi:hypothetical protein
MRSEGGLHLRPPHRALTIGEHTRYRHLSARTEGQHSRPCERRTKGTERAKGVVGRSATLLRCAGWEGSWAARRWVP